MNTHLTKTHLLVVGGTGFIGYHLVLYSKNKGWQVTSVSLNPPKKNRYVSGVNYLQVDISNSNNLKKKLVGSFTYVVNLGGYVNHSSFAQDGKNIIKVHFQGLTNLVNILLKKKISKLVQIGSSLEYGNLKSPQKEENVEGLPKSPYSIAKLASTRFLLTLYKTKKFPSVILRLFQVYGPRQDKNRILPQVINSCLKNKKFPVSTGNQIRDFCYIDDVINAILLALESKKIKGEIFNIGSGKPLKIKQIIRQVCKKIGKGKPEYGKFKFRKDENMKIYPDIKKARIKLKWKPKVEFDSGINSVINSYK